MSPTGQAHSEACFNQGTKSGHLLRSFERSSSVDIESIDRIKDNPRYHDLVVRRSRFGWLMSMVIFFAFVGFTALIAFDKALLATPIGKGVTSVGIPVGLGLIGLAIFLTSVYVWRANVVFDREMAQILEDIGQ
jgi:uncharacterized membrane protein (DUF485 family)